ncbi:MAG: restriction endonuclease subunit S [Bacteroidales bacterium]|nr:restriction endonuclease subunit S [Bacteroidales bacterium]
MTDTAKILPKLRFPEFENDGGWKVVKFKDIFTMLSNNTLSRAELSEQDGIALNIHYGDVLIKFGERLDLNTDNLPHIKDDEILYKYKSSYLKDGDVIFADTAEDETAGKCTEIRNIGKQIVISGLHTIPCRPKNEFAPYYLGYYLNSNAYHTKLLPLMQGAKVTSISRSSLQETIVVYPPSLPEQQKIAAFLTSLDEQISAHTKKLEALKAHKKGLMQQLFPANGEKTPKLRFPEFKNDGEWNFANGDKLFKPIVNKQHSSDLPVLAITQEQGAVPREMIDYNVIVSDKSIENYKIVEIGDFIISLRSFQGGIEYSHYKGLCSPAYIVLRKTNDNVCDEYYRHYFKSHQYIQDLNRNLEGIRDGKMVSYKQFSEIKIPHPSYIEQQKIASFLSSIDEMIQAQDDKIQKLKTYKNGLMQQMFVMSK